jgi:hypothetical protein
MAILIRRDRVTASRAAGLAPGKLSAPELEWSIWTIISLQFVAGLIARFIHEMPMSSDFILTTPLRTCVATFLEQCDRQVSGRRRGRANREPSSARS